MPPDEIPEGFPVLAPCELCNLPAQIWQARTDCTVGCPTRGHPHFSASNRSLAVDGWNRGERCKSCHHQIAFSPPTLLSAAVEEGQRQAFAIKEGKRLAAEGWMQTSRKYRHIARLPPGDTGLIALRRLDPGMARELFNRIESEAARTFMTISVGNPQYENCHLELDEETFEAFRKASQP